MPIPDSEPRSLFVDLGGTRRHVVEWGAPDAPVLLLLHGMRDHARSWDPIAARFATKYHVVAPELRGHGDSDWSRDGAYAIFDYVFDLARIVQALDLGAFHLVGHSLGGHVALRYAAAFPESVRTLTIVEGVELPIIRDQRSKTQSYPQRLRAWTAAQQALANRTPRYYATLEEARDRMAERNPRIDPLIIDHLAHHGVIAVAGRGFRWKYDNACRHRAPDDAHGVDLDEILEAVSCPTLLAYGDESWVPVPPHARLARLRDHRLLNFPGASHWVHHEAQDRFMAALAGFFAETESPAIMESERHA